MYLFIYLFIYYYYYFLSFLEDMPVDFRERGKEGEKKGEKHQCEREISIGCLLHAPWLRTKLSTQACTLTKESNLWPFCLPGDTLTNWAILVRAEKMLFRYRYQDRCLSTTGSTQFRNAHYDNCCREPWPMMESSSLL